MQKTLFSTIIALASLTTVASAQDFPPADPFGGDVTVGIDVQVDPFGGSVAVDNGFFDEFDESVGNYDPYAPDRDYVWVDAQVLSDGRQIDGFYRLRSRAGLTWDNGHYQGATWVNPGWRSTNMRRGETWVAGHRGSDGYWVCGQSRPQRRTGFRWTAGQWRGNSWVNGSWTPVQNQNRNQSIWVAGYTDNNRRWVPGFWRTPKRNGFRWKTGSWRYGTWTPGSWVPTRARRNSTWSAGYYDGNRWVDGQWHVNTRSGYTWSAPQRSANGLWTQGHWSASVRTSPRRHNVVRVRDITRTRRTQRSVWDRNRQLQRRVNRQHQRVQNQHQRVQNQHQRVQRQIQRDQRQIQRQIQHDQRQIQRDQRQIQRDQRQMQPQNGRVIRRTNRVQRRNGRVIRSNNRVQPRRDRRRDLRDHR